MYACMHNMPTCIVAYTIYMHIYVYINLHTFIYMCSYPSLWTNIHIFTHMLLHIYIENLSTEEFPGKIIS